MAWSYQSWVFVFGGAGQHSIKLAEVERSKMRYPTLEKFGLLVHYMPYVFTLLHKLCVVSCLQLSSVWVTTVWRSILLMKGQISGNYSKYL